MKPLDELLQQIQPENEDAARTAQNRWDAIAKPLNSLGDLESMVISIAALTGSDRITLNKRAVAVFCADNGVVAEGVSQSGPEITAIMAHEMAEGRSSVCKMAKRAGADVFPIDVGMLTPGAGVLDRHVSRGSGDIAKGPAMSRRQAEAAVCIGIETAGKLQKQGYTLLATGEMGIGNTTTSSAMASVLLHKTPETVTGKGAGLSDSALIHKVEIIKKAIACNNPDPADALDVLSKLGGYDIAAMAGLFIGGAVYRVPVIIDGFISAVAALTAARISPKARIAMLASHCSAEPAAKAVLQELGKKPILFAGMRLGEGTGAVCLMPILDLALAVYNGNSTFNAVGIEAYTPQVDKLC